MDIKLTVNGQTQQLQVEPRALLADVLRDYPADALNWHIGETPPAIGAYRASGGTRAVLGGLQRGHITNRDLPAVFKDIQTSMDQTQGRGIILSPACVIRHPVDEQAILEIIFKINNL